MQASLAIGAAAVAFLAYFMKAGRVWLVAAILIATVVPFTLFVIAPVNQQLTSIDPADARALALLEQRAMLHWFRTTASGTAFVLCLTALTRRA